MLVRVGFRLFSSPNFHFLETLDAINEATSTKITKKSPDLHWVHVLFFP